MQDINLIKGVRLNDEQQLLYELSLGNENSFRILFDLHRKRVFTCALKIIKSNTYAEEILHDVFLKIWQHKNPADINDLGAYLRIVTRNACLKMLHKHKMEIKANQALISSWTEEHNETEEEILLNDSNNILKEGISLLPQQQRKVYLLCRDEGLKYAQVAERLSLSPLTVKTHMQQALRFLRNYVTKHNDIAMFAILLQILSEKNS